MVTGGGIALAWLGTNSPRSLHVYRQGCAEEPQTLALHNETRFTAPALAFSGGKIWLAWAGTDANHSLNVLPIKAPHSSSTRKRSCAGSAVSRAQRSLPIQTPTADCFWHGQAQRRRGASASPLPAVASIGLRPPSPLMEWSGSGPSILALGISNMPRYFLAWMGADTNHSVNVQYIESFPKWPVDNSKTTVAEWAFGGPSVAYSGTVRRIVLGWTGIDPRHRLNIAIVGA